MNLLEKILEAKKESLAQRKKTLPLATILAQSRGVKNPVSLRVAVNVEGELSIIAEMKKKSPSAGGILKSYDPPRIAGAFESAGARGISVLTEENFFDGSPEHLEQVRKASKLPILRKDFIFDPYQIYETKVLGASCVLLTLAILEPSLFLELMDLSREIHLDALVEVHDETELDRALKAGADMVGVNNRNLKDLTVNLETTFRLRRLIPEGICVVSESGIAGTATISRLRRSWIQAALIGESILKSSNIENKLRAFVKAGMSSPEAEMN